MKFPSELRYTKSHEWARREDGKIRVGITEYAQKEISDVVFVELPAKGKAAQQGKALAVVESVKAAFDIYAPVSGAVQEVNQVLENDPGMINREPYGSGWIFQIDLANESEWDSLLSAEDYEKLLQQDVK